MIETLITLLVLFLVLAVVFWIAKLATSYFGAPPFVLQVVGLVLCLIFLLYLLRALGITPPGRLSP